MFRPVLGLLALAAAASSLPASAEVRAIGRFKDWRVYTETVGRDMICFAAVEPSDSAPRNVEHGEVTFFIATWKSGRFSNQPSLKVGYGLRTDIAPTAIVGRDRFPMFASGSEAFAADEVERRLLAAIKHGTELRIEAASTDNARTAYHFSLRGSSEAIDRARALCR
jgi:hypothetical protein